MSQASRFDPLRGPQTFWPFVALGAVVTLGIAAYVLLTGGSGVKVAGHGPVGSPVTVERSTHDVRYSIWVAGGDPKRWSVACQSSGGQAWVTTTFSGRTTVGPDGQTYRQAADISGQFGSGETLTCTSKHGATHLLVAQELGRTKVLKSALFGAVGLGAAGLALIGWFASRRRS